MGAVIGLGVLTPPAGAVAGSGGSGATTQSRATLDRGEGAELNLPMVAATGGSVLAIGFLVRCRPGLARRRVLRRFRTQLGDADRIGRFLAGGSQGPGGQGESAPRRTPPNEPGTSG